MNAIRGKAYTADCLAMGPAELISEGELMPVK